MNIINLMVGLMLLKIVGHHSAVLPGHDERRTFVQESGAHCTLQLARRHFAIGTTTVIAQSGLSSKVHFNGAQSTYSMMLSLFVVPLQWTVVVNQANTYKGEKSRYRVHNYIWMLKTEDDLLSILTMLLQSDSWNPHANFFLYVDTDLGANWLDVIRSFFDFLWQEFIINVVIMYPDMEHFQYKLLTWFPYDRTSRGADIELVTIGKCQNKLISPELGNLYPEKIPSNFDGYPLIVATALWEPFVSYEKNFTNNATIMELDLRDGFEIRIIQMVANKLNLKLTFRTHFLARSLSITNKTIKATGMFLDVYLRNADLCICMVRPDNKLHSVFDFTIQYTQDDVRWFVPYSQPIPHWKGLIKIFSPNLWLLSLAMFLLILSIVYIVGQWPDIADETATANPHQSPRRQRLDELAMQLASMMISVSTSFKNRTNRQRIIIFLWAMLCLNYTTAYTSGLISVLTTPRHIDQIKSVEDIVERGLDIGMGNQTLVFFMGSDEIDVAVRRKYAQCTTHIQCILNVAASDNFAFASSKLFAEKLMVDNLLPFVRPDQMVPVRVLPVPIASPPIEMILIKGHPLLPKINRSLMQLIESGLVEFWKKYFTPQFGQVVEDWRPLTIYHLMGPFLALLAGLLVAVAVLTFEFKIYYLRKIHLKNGKLKL